MKKMVSLLIMASLLVLSLGTIGYASAPAKNDKALVVVSFGSTFDETREKDIGGLETALKEAFPHREFRRAFTSKIIMKRLDENKGIKVHDLEVTLKNLKKEGFKDVLVQPTHLLHG